jgi:hypothetical protein
MYVKHKYLHKKLKWPLISAIFWDFTRRRLVVFADIWGQRMVHIFEGQAVQKEATLLLFLMFCCTQYGLLRTNPNVLHS